MALVEVICPLCRTKTVVKFGLNRQGKQRYQCKNKSCSKNTFILAYENKGCLLGSVNQFFKLLEK